VLVLLILASGFVTSLASDLNVTAQHAITIFWLFVVAVNVVGVVHDVFVHVLHVYPFFTVALIATLAHHLYVHAHVGLWVPSHALNVNAY